MQDFVNELIVGIALKNPIFWIIIIGAILSTVFYKKMIGMMGEFWTKCELRKLSKEYLVLNDIMLRTEDKKTHQIDHIVVSKYGIFVIETKHYNGYITGNDYDKKWCFKAGENKYYINNPVHQNYGHMKALEEIFDLKEEKFIPLICITSNAKTKISSSNVVRVYELVNRITSYKNEVLEDYQEIYKRLIELNITNKNERKNHNKMAEIEKEKKDFSLKNKCPKCGGELIARKRQIWSFFRLLKFS